MSLLSTIQILTLLGMQNSLIENKIKTYLKQFKDMGSNTLEIDMVKKFKRRKYFYKSIIHGIRTTR